VPSATEERLKRAYEAFGRGELDAILAVMGPDVEWDASDALAHRGVYRGHAGVSEYIRTIGETWEEFELVPEEFTESADGEHVMMLGHVRGRLKGSDESLEARFAHVGRMRDGKLARVKVCLDREAALRTLEGAGA
jgi:ketosteroid isomerase-like protein